MSTVCILMENNNQPITLDDLAGMMKDGFDDLFLA